MPSSRFSAGRGFRRPPQICYPPRPPLPPGDLASVALEGKPVENLRFAAEIDFRNPVFPSLVGHVSSFNRRLYRTGTLENRWVNGAVNPFYLTTMTVSLTAQGTPPPPNPFPLRVDLSYSRPGFPQQFYTGLYDFGNSPIKQADGELLWAKNDAGPGLPPEILEIRYWVTTIGQPMP